MVGSGNRLESCVCGVVYGEADALDGEAMCRLGGIVPVDDDPGVVPIPAPPPDDPAPAPALALVLCPRGR